jgi:predicted lipoprotein with Yx(FWY)xxD motif
MNRPLLAIAMASVSLLAGCTTNTPGLFGASRPARTADGVLVDAGRGMTLYTFDKDSSGKSVCTGGCAANWPPLLAPADAKPVGDYSVIARDDGTRQWAYKGKPLYYWSKDLKPGDKTGDGFNNVWRVARP